LSQPPYNPNYYAYAVTRVEEDQIDDNLQVEQELVDRELIEPQTDDEKVPTTKRTIKRGTVFDNDLTWVFDPENSKN
jgi:hypothetical protein